MRLQPKTLLAALALAVPGLALAAQPLTVNFDGQQMPMHETVQTVQTAAGPAQVRTWTWQSPNGQARVIITQTTGQAAPAWALHDMRAVAAQLAQAQTMMARMNAQMQAMFGPLSTLPVLWAQPQIVLPPLQPAAIVVLPQAPTPAPHPTLPQAPQLKV